MRHFGAFRQYHHLLGLIKCVHALSVHVNSTELNETAPCSEVPITQPPGKKGPALIPAEGVLLPRIFIPVHPPLLCAWKREARQSPWAQAGEALLVSAPGRPARGTETSRGLASRTQDQTPPHTFLKYILLIVLLQLSHFFLPFIPLCPVPPPSHQHSPTLVHVPTSSLASPFPTLFP